jgi:hypothetical protein
VLTCVQFNVNNEVTLYNQMGRGTAWFLRQFDRIICPQEIPSQTLLIHLKRTEFPTLSVHMSPWHGSLSLSRIYISYTQKRKSVCIEMINAYKKVGNLEGNKPLKRHWRTSVDNTKINVRELRQDGSTAFIWLRQLPMASSCEHDNGPSCSTQDGQSLYWGYYQFLETNSHTSREVRVCFRTGKSNCWKF